FDKIFSIAQMQAEINYNYTIEAAKLLEQSKLEVGQESSNVVELKTGNENEEKIASEDLVSKEESAEEAEKLFLEIEKMEVLSNELLVDLKHSADDSIGK
ncbi:35306_t:CDS:2, partial [Racocetra persica]